MHLVTRDEYGENDFTPRPWHNEALPLTGFSKDPRGGGGLTWALTLISFVLNHINSRLTGDSSALVF